MDGVAFYDTRAPESIPPNLPLIRDETSLLNVTTTQQR